MAASNVESHLRTGIQAARRGHHAPARRILRDVVDAAPDNELAWLWLARVTDDDAEKERALRAALRLNPDNRWAEQQLASGVSATPTTPGDTPQSPRQQTPEIVELKCPNCGGNVSLHSDKGVKTVVCNYCGAVLDLSEEQTQILAQVDPEIAPLQPIDVGMTATFGDRTYTVYGWMRYEGSDEYETWHWDEWLLVADDGHSLWLSYDPEAGFVIQERITDFEPFDPARSMFIKTPQGMAAIKERDQARIVALRGEFTWRARVGDPINYLDAESKHRIFSVEYTGDELEVHAGPELEPLAVWQAFGMDEKMEAARERAEARAAKKAKLGARAKVVGWLAVFSWVLVVFGGCAGHEVLDQQVVLTLDQNPTQRLGPVTLDETTRAHELILELDDLPTNSWATVSAWAYDEKKSKYLLVSAGFWDEEGYDDGYWHEADLKSSTKFKPVTAGEYLIELNLEELSPQNTPQQLLLTVRLQEGVWSIGYLVTIGILLTLTWFVYKIRGA
jgi:ribosomal protein S27E